jgi:carboxyl-terminal processing protease
MKKNETISKRLDSLTRYENRLEFSIIPQDSIENAQDTLFFAKRRRWMENLQKDPYLEQAVDALEMLKLKAL